MAALAFSIAALLLVVPTAKAQVTLPVPDTIHVGSEPSSLALDSASGLVFVTNTGANTVSSIDETNNSVLFTSTVGKQPSGVAIDPSTGLVFVANYGSNTVSILDEFNGTVVHTTHVGTKPQAVGVDPNLNQAFVANSGSNSISVINESTFTVVHVVSLGAAAMPYAVAVSPDLGQVFVADFGKDSVSIINESGYGVQTVALPTGSEPDSVAIDPNTGLLYVADYGTNSVSVVNCTSGTVTQSISVPAGPKGIDINLDQGVVFTADYTANEATEINDSSMTVIGSQQAGNEPFAIAVDSDLNDFYVADYGAAAVLQLEAVMPPAISVSPATFDAGGSASVTVTARAVGGLPPYKCEWLISNDGVTFTNFAASDCSSPISTGALSLTTYYALEVNDSEVETVYSGIAMVTVNPPVTAAAASSPSAVDTGMSATVFASESGGTQPYSFQWYSGLGCLAPISGATAHTYGTGPLTATASYSVMVTDSGGGPPSCAGVTVTVNPALTPPEIGLSASTVVGPTSSTASMVSPFGGGTPGFSCQWQVSADGTDFSGTGNPFGCTPASVAPTSVSGSATGTVYVRLAVNDNAGAFVFSPSATLTVVDEVSIACAPSPVTVGTKTLCTGTVLGFAPKGKITWSTAGAGKFSAATCKLVGGACSVKYTPLTGLSPVDLTASYPGDPLDAPVVSQHPLQVGQAASKTTVICVPRSIVAGSGRSVTCSARVTGYSPTGNVTWTQSGTGMLSPNTASCTLVRGSCRLKMTGVQAGGVAVEGTYTGDVSNAQSASGSSITVKQAKPKLAVSCTMVSLVAGTNETCTATLRGFAGSVSGENVTWIQTGGLGRVSFTPFSCTMTAGGTCSVTVAAGLKGTAAVKAFYAGDANNAPCFKVFSVKVTKA